MRNLDLDALQIFKAVADEGGVARAAAQLNRVQSNVSTRLKQLEAALDAPLFRRQNRRLVLSDQGRVLLSYADRLLRLSAEAQQAVRDGAPRGTLRLGTMESTAAARLPPVLAATTRPGRRCASSWSRAPRPRWRPRCATTNSKRPSWPSPFPPRAWRQPRPSPKRWS